MSAATTGSLSDGSHIRKVPSAYTEEQIATYLQTVGWQTTLPSSFVPNIDNLARLMYLHVLAFPIDNTDLHYTPEHHMPVTPGELFQRMVVERKGSYCFGQNGLFLSVIRGLGYRAYPAAGRVLVPNPSPGPSKPRMVYTPLSHLTILVQPYEGDDACRTYLVDLGFGGRGPLRPVLLADGSEGHAQNAPGDGTRSNVNEWRGGWVWGSFPPERHRVVRGSFLDSSLETTPGSSQVPPREWHMQVSHSWLIDRSPATLSPEDDWTTLYTFTELEFFQWDIDAASFAVCQLPGQLFRDTLVCMKRFEVFIEDASDEREKAVLESEETKRLRWIGRWSLEGTKALKSVGARRVDEMPLSSEKGRIQVLREVFEIPVPYEAEKWIEGRASAIPKYV